MTPEELRDTIRRAIMRYLAARRGMKMTGAAIQAEVAHEQGTPVTETLLKEELTYLTDSGWITASYAPSGIVSRYQATPKLCDAADRKEL